MEAGLRATLGNVYSDLGEYTNAVAMHEKALRIRKKLHGNQHPDVAKSLHDLGTILNRQGHWPEAEIVARDALLLRKKLLGHEDVLVAQSLILLAGMLRAEFKFAQAEALSREALTMHRKLWGNDHAEVARTLGMLGLLLWDEGKVSRGRNRATRGPRHLEADLLKRTSRTGRLAEAPRHGTAYPRQAFWGGSVVPRIVGDASEAVWR